MKKIGFIGCGNMAGAIITGLLSSGTDAADICLYDIDADKLAHYEKEGMKICGDESSVALSSDVTFLAVKPQVIEPLLKKLGSSAPHTVYVSIAAGISTATVKRLLGYDAKVVRAMPNTPLMLGLGATAVSHTPPVSDDEFGYVRDIFASSGMVEELDEEHMNSIISVNGSSPAYVYYIAKAVVDGAAVQGIAPDVALRLFAKVLEGSAKMLTESGRTPAELIDMVCSKGGTTIEAVRVLEKQGVGEAFSEAMKACTKRACELDID